MKTTRDKLRAMMAELREVNERNKGCSGNIENVFLLDQLLDDNNLEVDEIEEARALERVQTTAREEALVAAGDKIQ